MFEMFLNFHSNDPSVDLACIPKRWEPSLCTWGDTPGTTVGSGAANESDPGKRGCEAWVSWHGTHTKDLQRRRTNGFNETWEFGFWTKTARTCGTMPRLLEPISNGGGRTLYRLSHRYLSRVLKGLLNLSWLFFVWYQSPRRMSHAPRFVMCNLRQQLQLQARVACVPRVTVSVFFRGTGRDHLWKRRFKDWP